MKNVVAREGSTITLSDGDSVTTVDLYSRDGLELLSALWTKIAYTHRVMYEPTWLGVPIIQLPGDIVVMQELIWKIRPDVIVECGLAHGGAAVMYASICEMIGHGRIVGVDVDIRKHNRVALESHPMAHRIELIEGSSIEAETVEQVAEATAGAGTVLVVLDSNHTTEHVYRELQLYSPMVTPGSYLVARDGVQAYYWDGPTGKTEWRDNSPLHALRRFVAESKEFCVDEHYGRLQITTSPEGFLRRRRAEERAA